MKLKRIAERGRALVFVLGFALVLLTAGISAADRETSPGEVLLLSDEIFGNSVKVTRPSNGDAGVGNDDNGSGFADGTNPGQGSGTSNSPNEGTDNPNNAPSGS